MNAGKKKFGILLIGVLLLTVPVSSTRAQYFGQNKVQYKTFDFKILKTEHFDIYYYPKEFEAAKLAAHSAERWYARYAKLLHHDLSGRQPLVLYASHPDFEQTNAISGQLGEGTGGVTEALKRRIVLPLGASLAETDHVIGHELVHAFQYDITGEAGGGRAGFAAPSALMLPLWFIEGMAEYLSLGSIDANTAMWMRDASQKKLPSFDELDDPEYFPYRYGQALWAYVSGLYGDEVVGKILKEGNRTGDAARAFRNVLKMGPDTLVQNWQKALDQAYEPYLKTTEKPEAYGSLLIKGKEKSASLNVAPSLSPDGKNLVFLSSKSLFSIDMFLADASTGEIKRTIIKNELDPHFQSLQFIYSAGAWDAQGQRLAFAAISSGHPVLSILNVKQNKIEREIELNQLDEILNPTWSPDGRVLAFSATAGGLSDLYLYDLDSDSLKRVTHDLYADLQPAWSPDGKYIAFVTDRFSTDLHTLRVGNTHLALLDPQTGEITALPDFATGKNINPQWSPDSRSLYFISDHSGISNLYRMDLTSHNIAQVTNLFTGVSGITELSPAVTVAQQSGRVAYSVYVDGTYSIYTIDHPDLLTCEPLPASDGVPADTTGGNPAQLPPLQRVDSELLTLLHDPLFGLPDEHETEVTNYHPRLSLDYVGQPYLAAGIDRFGTYAVGGASLFWSDMLGNQNLATLFQVSSNFKDFAGLVGYQNTKHRWNWGGVVQQVPYVTGAFAAGYDTVGAQEAYVEQELIQRQINRSVSTVLEYPFSRVQRLEFNLGYQNISFSNELKTLAVSVNSGQTLINDTKDLPSPGSLNIGQVSTALVYDNSYFGATSPILGQRYRLEVNPYFGSLFMVNVLSDYRRYFMPLKPYTLAFRILHYGRYGRDAEDSRLSPLFLGYPGLVRGYDFNSFDASESLGNGGQVIDRLFGSKMLVGNFELRMPLYNLLTLGRGFFYGSLPIEIAGFYDAGVAWQQNDKAWFLGGDRKLVSSAGAALRLNIGGYLVLELDYVHPFDRPQKNWLWQFSITPGF